MAVPAWVLEVGTAAQIVIAVAAIWGERIRARLSRPRLQLTLRDEVGASEPREVAKLGTVNVRYYRLEVRNPIRFSVANEVQVFITKIVMREQSGRITMQFSGASPLEWQHRELYQTTRSIGHATVAVANLFFLHSDFTQLTLSAQAAPPDVGDKRPGAQNLWITAVARGLNAESAALNIEIQWDGLTEGHFVVRAVHEVPPGGT
jgi:hypothetical protein